MICLKEEEEEEESDDEEDNFGPKKKGEEEEGDPVARKFLKKFENILRTDFVKIKLEFNIFAILNIISLKFLI